MNLVTDDKLIHVIVKQCFYFIPHSIQGDQLQPQCYGWRHADFWQWKWGWGGRGDNLHCPRDWMSQWRALEGGVNSTWTFRGQRSRSEYPRHLWASRVPGLGVQLRTDPYPTDESPEGRGGGQGFRWKWLWLILRGNLNGEHSQDDILMKNRVIKKIKSWWFSCSKFIYLHSEEWCYWLMRYSKFTSMFWYTIVFNSTY